jgi:16S rRNA (guanine(527)-N(7))-methyltransferase RsmG
MLRSAQHDGILEIYKKELLKWSERVNLVGPEARENLDAHVDEALVAAEILKPRGEVLDFGSGGGLPAIPMAIVAPEAHFHLVEADQKKWAFLKHVVRECGLSAVIYGDRLAAALKRFPTDLRFSLVTSRAVGSPEEWVPLVAGRLIGRVALFQSTTAVPPFADAVEVFPLPRGTSNYLVTFHVKQ